MSVTMRWWMVGWLVAVAGCWVTPREVRAKIAQGASSDGGGDERLDEDTRVDTGDTADTADTGATTG